MSNVLSSYDEALASGELRTFKKKTKYHEYEFVVRSEDEIKFNVSQNISIKPTGGEYFKPLFTPHFSADGSILTLDDLNQEDVWLDAGGHIGIFATRLLTQFPKVKKVYSYEPFHNNVDFAQRNLKLNGVDDRCEIIEKALVHDDQKSVDFFLSQDSGKHSVHPIKGRATTTVEAININDALKGVTAIKMDIEGMEYDMVKAITDWSNIRLAIIEYHFHYSWLTGPERESKFAEMMEIFNANFDRVFVNKNAASGKHFITHFAGFKNI